MRAAPHPQRGSRALRATGLCVTLCIGTPLLAGGAPDLLMTETESARSPSRLLETPLSISVVSAEEILDGRPAETLDLALQLVPGVLAQSGRNFAQDSRISIRGYGARAAFGVRGIKLLVDGVPNTLPDGQSELDSIELAFVERIEVVRGPVSSLYGGGAGGVISISTLAPTEEPTHALRVLFGSHHLSRYAATTTGSMAGTGYALGLARTRISGYRDHSRAEQTVFLAKLERDLPDGTSAVLEFSSVSAPEAQDPGGLNQGEVDMDREAARGQNVVRDAGEDLDQQKLSLRLRRHFGADRELVAMGYTLWRNFDNKLPIDRQVDLDRRVFGGSAIYRDTSRRIRWMLGVDYDEQRDVRENFQNLAGTRGMQTLHQSETVRAFGAFAEAEVKLECGLGFVGGLRYDWTEFVVGDRFVNQVPSNGDSSDRERFRHVSPRFGVFWSRVPALFAYANLASAFVVPTTTELAAPPGGGGFASDLDPETTLGFELGAKGVLRERFFYDVVVFDLRLRDVAVPFGTMGGVTLFRDAGKVRRRGAEVAFSLLLAEGLSARGSYTYADYEYRDYDALGPTGVIEFDGKREPNTSRHVFGGELRLERPSGFFASLLVRDYSDLYTNDANTAESDGATLSELRMGWHIDRGDAVLTPFFGVRNWSDVEYDGSIRPNAFGGRYYEPAPEVELYAGVELTWGR